VADDSPETRAWQRGFKQKSRRDDYALDLFEEARRTLGADPARFATVLGELSRLYNAVLDAPIVDLATRRHIMQLVEAGRTAEAGALLEARHRLYAPLDDDERRQPGAD
jgi:hypothetical protein